MVVLAGGVEGGVDGGVEGGGVLAGIKVTVAVALAPLLVAVTTTFCCAEIELGAEYNPPEVMLPTDGLIVQLALATPPPPMPVVVAENCWLCEADSETEVGLTAMPEDPLGVRDTVACAVVPAFPTQAATTVTFWAALMVAGAV